MVRGFDAVPSGLKDSIILHSGSLFAFEEDSERELDNDVTSWAGLWATRDLGWIRTRKNTLYVTRHENNKRTIYMDYGKAASA
jgi:hypothetical protein